MLSGIIGKEDKSIVEIFFNPSEEIYPKYYGVANTKLYIEKMCEFFSKIRRNSGFSGSVP